MPLLLKLNFDIISLSFKMRKTMDEKISFCIFCIENTARSLGISGTKMYDKLEKSGLIDDYIFAHYDTLHTQSKEYIINDIKNALEAKGVR
ncbi:DUF3791 domain-containing protein [Campylobacter sp.]|uniref:DUF3791 domain-containing protein n=1 Tax=Campylobacter sp. TaxID=205 RepID=UPI002A7F97EC|nr:DUF3791 domain-containing protein [Campylobacter sp.]MDY4446262.1 DUF3791 domain-containing protein [Campylobacter sp.]